MNRAWLVLFVTCFILARALDKPRLKGWKHGKIGSCSYIFASSRRESFRNAQADPLLVWLGPPSQAVRVEGKHGSLPLPSAWRSFANILFVQCVHNHEQYEEEFVDFLRRWVSEFAAMASRPLYLSGSAKDREGDFLLRIAVRLVPSFSLRGVFFPSTCVLPRAMFFAHKSFETWNSMNFWTVNRARNPVVCNTRLAELEFFSHDVKLTYAPKASSFSSPVHSSEESDRGTINGVKETEKTHAHGRKQEREMFEYELRSVSTWERCYADVDEFATMYSAKPTLSKEFVDPALSATTDSQFPVCNARPQNGSSSDIVWQDNVAQLLQQNVSVFVFTEIAHAAEIICSFYIGIFAADALAFPDYAFFASTPAAGVVERFNAAPLETMPSSWGASVHSEKSPGLLQESLREEKGDEQAILGMMLLRSQPHGKNRVTLSRVGATGIFSRLLHALGDAAEVDLIELIAMDRLEESSSFGN